MSEYHQTVMVREVVELLSSHRMQRGVFLDATLGGGGHSEALLQLDSNVRVVGVDQDGEAIEAGLNRLKKFGDRFRVVRANFRDLREHLKDEVLAGAVMDLGVSSRQLDESSRGFSFRNDGPLDMRMDVRSGISAAEIVNTWREEKLADLFFEMGEERYSRKIARVVVEERRKRPFRRTLELAELIARLAGGRAKGMKTHPATRVFQALRIGVNDEMGALREGLEAVWGLLGAGGRLAVITFHSIEDRIVKNQFRHWSREEGKLLMKKPMYPTEEEIRSNIRSRSAKLRAIEKN